MAFDAKAKMEKTLEGIKNEMNTIRTGRASAAMFDKVRVDYYGQKSPLNQVAQISIPEARTVVISPFDKSLISDIEKAKTYSAKIGRIRFFYSWSKGTYFYIHKIIDDKDSYVDSVRFYSSLPASDLMNSLLKTDGL